MLYHFHKKILNKILMHWMYNVHFLQFINMHCMSFISLHMYTCINLLIYIELHLTTPRPRKNFVKMKQSVKRKVCLKIFKFNLALKITLIKPTYNEYFVMFCYHAKLRKVFSFVWRVMKLYSGLFLSSSSLFSKSTCASFISWCFSWCWGQPRQELWTQPSHLMVLQLWTQPQHTLALQPQAPCQPQNPRSFLCTAACWHQHSQQHSSQSPPEVSLASSSGMWASQSCNYHKENILDLLLSESIQKAHWLD